MNVRQTTEGVLKGVSTGEEQREYAVAIKVTRKTHMTAGSALVRIVEYWFVHIESNVWCE